MAHAGRLTSELLQPVCWQYVGTLIDGLTFDSTYEHKERYVTRPNEMMKVGARLLQLPRVAGSGHGRAWGIVMIALLGYFLDHRAG